VGREGLEEGRKGKKKRGCSQSLESFFIYIIEGNKLSY
jgi:hypothetical protein